MSNFVYASVWQYTPSTVLPTEVYPIDGEMVDICISQMLDQVDAESVCVEMASLGLASWHPIVPISWSEEAALCGNIDF